MKQILKLKRGKIFGTIFGAMLLGLSIFGADLSASALSATVATDKTSVAVGESFKTYVKMADVASWNVHVWASGPVNGCTIDSANVTEDASNLATKTIEAECVATGAGSVVLSLFGEIADETNTEISLSDAVSVSVVETVEIPTDTPVETPKEEPAPVSEPVEQTPAQPAEAPASVAPTTAVPVVTNTTTPDTQARSENSTTASVEPEVTPEPKADEKVEKKEENVENKESEDDSNKTMIIASGSTTNDKTKTILVIALAVVATMVGCAEVYLILSSRKKERLKALREKAQALQVATTTMQLAQAMEKK